MFVDFTPVSPIDNKYVCFDAKIDDPAVSKLGLRSFKTELGHA